MKKVELPTESRSGATISRRSSASLPAACVANVLFVLMLAVAACSKQESHSRIGVLAEVGGDIVTEGQFRRWWSKLLPNGESPGDRQALLDKQVQRAQSVRRARALGLDRDPEVVEAVESLLVARLHETRLKPDLAAVHVEESELRAYYEAASEGQFRVGRRSRVAVLWLDPRGVAPLVARCQARLQQARLEFNSPGHSQATNEPGFGPISITYSEHRPSRFKGGDIGCVELDSRSADPWRNAIAEVAATLEKPGEISPVVARKEGVFLVRLIETAPAHLRSFDQVRGKIEKTLIDRKQAAIRERFDHWIREESTVRFHSEALAALGNLQTRKSSETTFNAAFNKSTNP